MMKKDEFITEFATKSNMAKKDAKVALDALQQIVYTHMNDDGGIKLFDGVTLARSWMNERVYKNPQTGEPVTVPGHYKPVVKFGKLAKDSVNK